MKTHEEAFYNDFKFVFHGNQDFELGELVWLGGGSCFFTSFKKLFCMVEGYNV